MTKPTPKRWFRFSLRTLLLVTAVVCIALGWKMNQVHRQRRAVEAIQAYGGIVGYDYQNNADLSLISEAQPPGPAWFRTIAGDDFLAHVWTVVVRSGEFTDAAPLADLPHLRLALLDSSGVTDLTPLAELRELEMLFLSDTPVNDLTPLASLPKLSLLELNWTPAVSDKEIEKLQQVLPDLKIHKIELLLER